MLRSPAADTHPGCGEGTPTARLKAQTGAITWLGDVQEAIPAAQQALDTSIYEVRIQCATQEERRYMRAMAELGEGPYRSGQLARKLGGSTPELPMTRQHLIDKGLACATDDFGYIDFTVSRLDEFMRRHLPNQASHTSRPKLTV